MRDINITLRMMYERSKMYQLNYYPELKIINYTINLTIKKHIVRFMFLNYGVYILGSWKIMFWELGIWDFEKNILGIWNLGFGIWNWDLGI